VYTFCHQHRNICHPFVIRLILTDSNRHQSVHALSSSRNICHHSVTTLYTLCHQMNFDRLGSSPVCTHFVIRQKYLSPLCHHAVHTLSPDSYFCHHSVTKRWFTTRFLAIVSFTTSRCSVLSGTICVVYDQSVSRQNPRCSVGYAPRSGGAFSGATCGRAERDHQEALPRDETLHPSPDMSDEGVFGVEDGNAIHRRLK
jgi:hypothetical protein